MSNWLLKASELWLKPVYEMLMNLLVREEVIHADETTLRLCVKCILKGATHERLLLKCYFTFSYLVTNKPNQRLFI